MDRKPTVAELMLGLQDLVNWEVFAVQLPGIRPPHIGQVKKENVGDIANQKLALYNKWLSVNPKACWNDVIVALKKIEENDIATEVEQNLLEPAGKTRDTESCDHYLLSRS